jgi:hypothetical protein
LVTGLGRGLASTDLAVEELELEAGGARARAREDGKPAGGDAARRLGGGQGRARRPGGQG